MCRISRLVVCILVAVFAILSLCFASQTDPLDCYGDDYLINFTPTKRQTRCTAQDRDALLAFKRGISSDPNGDLSDWRTTTDCCKWSGVTCDGVSGRVVSLNLADKSLQGFISPALSRLSKLQVLKLYNNYFTGKLPSSLGSLSELAQLCVSGGGLTGGIPDSYGTRLQNLLNLDVGNNVLSGPLSSTIGMMTNLKRINVNGNRFSGAIPVSFGKLSSLYYANLGNNSFSGALPDAFNDDLTSLVTLLLDKNLITAVPADLNNLQNLQSLSLANNPIRKADNLAGLATAPKLSQLDLSHCQLRGGFPTWIISSFPHTNAADLSEDVTPGLDLSFNALIDRIPPNIGSVLPDYLEMLYLNNNRFYGNIPSSLSSLASLRLFNISNNHLDGKIPQVAPLNAFDASAYKGNSGLCGSPLPRCRRHP